MRLPKFLLPLFFGLLYLLPLDFRWLWQPDETRYAEISREMLQRGDWIVPHFLGLRYFEKPVAGYWINNLSQWLLGDSNFAVRFGAALSTALSAALVYWLAMRLWQDRKTAYAAVLIYLSFFIVYAIGTYTALDAMFNLWLTAGMCCFYQACRADSTRGRVYGYLLLGLACGMALMTKGFLALAVPVICVLPWMCQQKRLKELFCYGPLAVLSATLITLPWALAVAWREPDYWHYFFWVEHIQRFAMPDAQHKEPFWFFLPVLMLGSLPWLGLLPGALRHGWQQRTRDPAHVYLLYWAVMPFILFSIAKGKLPTYILPCFAPLALLFAAYAQHRLQQGRLHALRANGLINLIFGLLLAATILLMRSSIYDQHETWKAALGVAAFAAWALIGRRTWRRPQIRWQWAALCPLLLALLIGYAIPQERAYAKQPQLFIREVLPTLRQSGYVASDNVGLASALGWELKRSDITLVEEKGELKYGLDYPDARGRFIDSPDLPRWLQQKRRLDNVSLVLLLADSESSHSMPPADVTYQRGRVLLLFYRKTAP